MRESNYRLIITCDGEQVYKDELGVPIKHNDIKRVHNLMMVALKEAYENAKKFCDVHLA